MISHWLYAARLKTLPVSLCPVILALALANDVGSFNLPVAIVIFLCVLLIQIGTNFANDYFDYIKGADTSDRIGPKRMTQAGNINPQAMKHAFTLMFIMAVFCGIYLVYHGGWPILCIGICSVFLLTSLSESISRVLFTTSNALVIKPKAEPMVIRSHRQDKVCK